MELMALNPWWINENAIEMDKHIVALDQFKYTYHPSLLEEDFRPGNLYTVRGPRQIGKTTFLKMFIREKLGKIPKVSIFYWSCDNLLNSNDLIELIEEYAQICDIKNVSPEFILLDEITGIKDWQRALKFVIDNDIVKSTCFILTGSNAFDLKKGSERLPGRRGKHGKDLFFLPLTFREYVEMTDPDWYGKHKNDDLDEIKLHNRALRIAFERYLITGGIPLVINEYEENGIIPNYIFDLYYSWIIGDILKEGKNEQTLKELIKGILLTYTTQVSWDSLAKRSSIKSHVTISSYVEILSNIFVTLPCYFYNIHEGKVDHKKNKKLYFFDPFLLAIFKEKLNIDVDKAKVIEGIVASHLKRKNILEDIYYTQVKKETDFIDEDLRGFEVKYQNKISKEDFKNIRSFKEFMIISKEIFAQNVIPIHAFLFVE